MRIAYLFADLIYFVLYHLVHYRLNVVRKNLRDSFPESNEQELRDIERRFYHNFSDIFVEVLCLPLLSKKTIAKRMIFENMDIINNHVDNGRSVVAYFAHTFNWEWGTSAGLHIPSGSDGRALLGQVYRPLKSKFFDGLMLKLRGKFHTTCYPKSNVLRHLLKAKRDGLLTVTGFMSDQHPSHGDSGHYTMFLNHPTLMITGTETLASKLKMAVVFWDMEKLSRGYYRITVRPMCDDASTLPHGELTENYTRMLETTIKRDPAIWLWSHNRWKHPVNPQSSVQP